MMRFWCRDSVKTDYQVELAVVIGSLTRYVDSPAASSVHVACYAISNDVSERESQIERRGQWERARTVRGHPTADAPWVDCLIDGAADPSAEWVAKGRQHRGRLLNAHEVADAAHCLAVPRAGSTAGTAIAVDGGMAVPRLRPRS